MPAWLLWERIKRTAKKVRDEGLEEHKKWILDQLIQARSVSFGLQANGEVPPSWEDIQKQKKGKGPTQGKVEKARKSFLRMLDRHQQGLASPYAFEEYMGLATPDGQGHVFEPPPPELVKTSQEFKLVQRQKVSAMEERIMGHLDRMIEKHGGDAPLDEMFSRSQ